MKTTWLKFSFVADFQPIQFNHGCTRINLTRFAPRLLVWTAAGSEAPRRFRNKPSHKKRCRRCALPPQSKFYPCSSVVINFTGTKSSHVDDATHQKPRSCAGLDARTPARLQRHHRRNRGGQV